jgi:hypothetical protein
MVVLPCELGIGHGRQERLRVSQESKSVKVHFEGSKTIDGGSTASGSAYQPAKSPAALTDEAATLALTDTPPPPEPATPTGAAEPVLYSPLVPCRRTHV